MSLMLHNFRCLVAEMMLRWALDIFPDGSDEQYACAQALHTYVSKIGKALKD